MRQIQILLILGDVFLAILAFHTPSLFELRFDHAAYLSLRAVAILAVFVLTLVFSSFLFDLYNYKKAFSYTLKELAVMIPLAAVVSLLIQSIINLLFRDVAFDWRISIFIITIFGVYQLVWRIAYQALICSSAMTIRVLIVGSGERMMKIASLIASSKRNYVIVGSYSPKQDEASSANTGPDTLTDEVQRGRVDMIVVAVRQRRGIIPLQELLGCKLAGVEVVDSPTFYEELQSKLLIEEITASWFIFSDGFRMNSGRKRLKRIGDIFFALIGLICSLPFMPIIALLIKVDSKGPVLLLQTRVGEGEKSFPMYKLRTMKVDAESQTGAVWAKKNDHRITRVGRILRKLRIDELPQLYNVLKGDMSFIGPRPERPEFVERLNTILPYYSERHCLKPGITGWAQVMYSYGASDEDALEKLRYDLYYIKNLSFQLECTVILETIKVILFGRGSR